MASSRPAALPPPDPAAGLQAGHVFFIGHTASLGGAELCLLDIAPEFDNCVVCLFEEGPLAGALIRRGVQVKILKASRAFLGVRRNGGPLAALRSIPEILRLARGVARLVGTRDVIYANTQKAWVVAALVGWCWRRTVIWHLHDILSARHFDRFMCQVGVFLANRVAAAVIVNSRATAAAFVAQGGRSELPCVVHNGIDEAPFAAAGYWDRLALRQQLRLGEATTVGLFGRVARWKGQHVMLDALKRLPGIRAIVVGGPLFGEEAYLDELRRLADDPVLAGRVTFLGFRSDVPALMNAVDVVVHTSIVPEPFGRVLVEGMLAHRPVVATTGGGVTEVIADGIDGMLVAPGDAGALARTIDAVASDPTLTGKLTRAGYRKAKQCFSRERMAKRIADVVGEIVAVGAGEGVPGVTTRLTADRTQPPPTPGRIWFITHSAELSGAELSLIDIATRLGEASAVCVFQEGPVVNVLRDRGIRVEVLEGESAVMGVRSRGSALTVLRALPGVLRLALAVGRLAKAGDVLYANSQKGWVVSAVAGWWGRRTVVWHLRDVLSAAHFGGPLRWATIFLANHVAARVVVNSRATGEAFVAHGGKRELLHVVHNGIDGAPFAALRDAECAALRRKLGLGGCVAVGLFGRVAHWKGQHVLLEALKSLPDVKAIIVGDALFGEQAYQQQLLQLADVPALRGRVRFMSYRSDIPALMRAVDIVVHTSVEPEPFGRVIVEGMLAQRPVIATAAGGVMEILEHGVDGILVPPNDAGRLASAIDALARDPAWARKLAVAGCRKAQEQFSVEKMCVGIRDAIRGIVAVTQ